jgi:hypothetical protein
VTADATRSSKIKSLKGRAASSGQVLFKGEGEEAVAEHHCL